MVTFSSCFSLAAAPSAGGQTPSQVQGNQANQGLYHVQSCCLVLSSVSGSDHSSTNLWCWAYTSGGNRSQGVADATQNLSLVTKLFTFVANR